FCGQPLQILEESYPRHLPTTKGFQGIRLPSAVGLRPVLPDRRSGGCGLPLLLQSLKQRIVRQGFSFPLCEVMKAFSPISLWFQLRFDTFEILPQKYPIAEIEHFTFRRLHRVVVHEFASPSRVDPCTK